MRRHWFPKRYADTVMRLRVPSGFLLAILFGLLARPTRDSLIAGTVIAVTGLGIRAWAAGHLAKNRDLASGGPYAWTRNPLYLGTLLAALGLAVAARSIAVFAVTLGVFILVYLPVIEQEEQHLLKLFAGYRAYADRVPLLWPKVPGVKPSETFQRRLYWKNEEWKAALAFLAGMGYLAWKM